MTTRQALANLMLVFLEGRGYNSMNPYMRPEIQAGFKALGITSSDESYGAAGIRAIAEGRRTKKHRHGG